jgi:hypothetical protein
VNVYRLMISLLTISILPIAPSLPQERQSDKSLPKLGEFLKGVRAHLHSDRVLLSKYTYIEKYHERQLDKKGKVKSTEESIYEVYPSFEENLTYHRLISKNGKPLSEKELAKQDQRHDKKLQEHARRTEREGTNERAHRLAKEAEVKRKEEEEIDEIFRQFQIAMVGREYLDGNSTIVLTFSPRPDYKPHTTDAKINSKFAGRAWICEQDYEVVRIQVNLIDNLTFGMGVLLRLNKGASGVGQRRKINDEIWLPAETRFTFSGRLLLLKGGSIDATTEYSNYKKFTVETQVKFPAVKNT